jgi:hypothetical protein
MSARPTTDREAAWDALHEALPARGQMGLPSYDPGRQLWQATAIGPHPGRGKLPVVVSGTGEDETAALRDLDDRLRGIPKPAGAAMDALRRRFRLAYVEGAEDWSRRASGRGLTAGELAGVIGR